MNTKNTPDVWERMKLQLRPGDNLIARTKAAARIKRAKWKPCSAAFSHHSFLRPVMIGAAVCAAAAVIALPVLFAASRGENILSAAGSLSSEESASMSAHTIDYSELKLPEGGELVLPDDAISTPTDTMDIVDFKESCLKQADLVAEATVTKAELRTYTIPSKFIPQSYSTLLYTLRVERIFHADASLDDPQELTVEVLCYTCKGELLYPLKEGHRYILPIADNGPMAHHTIQTEDGQVLSADTANEYPYSLVYPFLPSIEVTRDGKYLFPDAWKSLRADDALPVTGGEAEGLLLRNGEAFLPAFQELIGQYILSPEREQNIREDYFRTLPENERPDSPNSVMIYDYGGTYEGAELVLVAKTGTGFDCVLEGFSIAGYSFRMPYPGYRLHSGSSFYEIEEAYEKGIITEKSLRELQRRYGTESTTTAFAANGTTGTTQADRPPQNHTTTETVFPNTTSKIRTTPTTCFYGSASIMEFSTLAEYKEALLSLSNKEALYQAFLKSAKISHLSLNESEFEMLLTDRYFILPILPAGSALSKAEFLANGTSDFYVTLSDGNTIRFTCWHGKKELWSPEDSKKTSIDNSQGFSIVHDHVQYAFPVDDTKIDMNYGFYTWKVGDYFCRMRETLSTHTRRF